jgi:hypothetical protein
MKALSIRQPWAWLIIHGGKDIENRNRSTNLRGRIYVHASLGMTHDEYTIGDIMAAEAGLTLPAFDDLQRGGIIGTVEITDCVQAHESPWFFGPFGYTLANPVPLPFKPCKGKLGFFHFEPHFHQEYMCVPYEESEGEKRLRELAEQYIKRTEEYDRAICTGPIVNGYIMPSHAAESSACNRNALMVREDLFTKVRQLGFTRQQWLQAIRRAERQS